MLTWEPDTPGSCSQPSSASHSRICSRWLAMKPSLWTARKEARSERGTSERCERLVSTCLCRDSSDIINRRRLSFACALVTPGPGGEPEPSVEAIPGSRLHDSLGLVSWAM